MRLLIASSTKDLSPTLDLAPTTACREARPIALAQNTPYYDPLCERCKAPWPGSRCYLLGGGASRTCPRDPWPLGYRIILNA